MKIYEEPVHGRGLLPGSQGVQARTPSGTFCDELPPCQRAKPSACPSGELRLRNDLTDTCQLTQQHDVTLETPRGRKGLSPYKANESESDFIRGWLGGEPGASSGSACPGSRLRKISKRRGAHRALGISESKKSSVSEARAGGLDEITMAAQEKSVPRGRTSKTDRKSGDSKRFVKFSFPIPAPVTNHR